MVSFPILRPFPHRRTPLHVAFTPPVETFCARRFGVDSKGLPLAKKPDGDVSDLEWIRPGTAEDRQKIVACLIKRKADPNRVDYHDHSALHYACVWGWVPTVDLLLEEGADPECSNIGAISVSRGAVVPSRRRRDSPPSDEVSRPNLGRFGPRYARRSPWTCARCLIKN